MTIYKPLAFLEAGLKSGGTSFDFVASRPPWGLRSRSKSPAGAMTCVCTFPRCGRCHAARFSDMVHVKSSSSSLSERTPAIALRCGLFLSCLRGACGAMRFLMLAFINGSMLGSLLKADFHLETPSDCSTRSISLCVSAPTSIRGAECRRWKAFLAIATASDAGFSLLLSFLTIFISIGTRLGLVGCPGPLLPLLGIKQTQRESDKSSDASMFASSTKCFFSV
mmetsp:Transcript_53171/g.116025  ORF Transcript_53171/g.116025 Transcript_53171/m.116025 type:complete len:223 (-) Transcript_53171:460-1128(-)